MDILDEVFQEINRHGMCQSHCEFSRTWLNKSSRYMSMIRASDRKPSLDAIACLAARLKQHTDQCKESRFGELREKADWLYPLTQKVWTELYRRGLG